MTALEMNVITLSLGESELLGEKEKGEGVVREDLHGYLDTAEKMNLGYILTNKCQCMSDCK